ncbi:MAG: ComF family protein [Candidatus Omnitrophica bacterium]|nr:ComF family protein [Candidatus Omnitrophota bacterium]
MITASTVSDYQEAFLRLFYPSYCGLCGTFLEIHEKHLCRTCLDQVASRRHLQEETLLTKRYPPLKEAWALYPYEGPIRDILKAVKFQKKRWLLHVFNEAIDEWCQSVLGETSYDCLIPIPLSRKRNLEREFNQAEIIAGKISRITGIPVVRNLLAKKFSSHPQSDLGREERLANVWNSFKMTAKRKYPAKSVLLVDDILTTGATAQEAAECLQAEGIRHIGFLALAHTEMES